MTTMDPLPPPSTPTRGQVQKTWVDRIVLAGFMDEDHFSSVVGDYLSNLPEDEKVALLTKAEEARSYVRTLPTEDLSEVEIELIPDDKIAHIQSDQQFQQAFRDRNYRFAYVRVDRIIALQTTVSPRHDPVPTSEDELLKLCLPNEWEVPAEITFIPPQGPILITTSTPAMRGIKLAMENGKVSMSPSPHLNLLNVREFDSRFYLYNGYHRAFDLLTGGVQRVPAIITKAQNPSDIGIQDDGFFSAAYTQRLSRPPLIKDFLSSAAIPTKVRERRHGVTISLDFKPFTIGI